VCRVWKHDIPKHRGGYETTGYVQVMLYFPQRFACGRQYSRMRWAERIASVLVKGWKDELDGWQKSSCVITVEHFVGDTPCIGDHIKRR
jgi:hypothetical protein